jgi:Xaa-Pro aminopeptidase
MTANTDPPQSRVARLASRLESLEVEALLVVSLVNVRYLTGFTGSNGLVLVFKDGAELGPHRFLTDFRYTTQASEQVPEDLERQIVKGELLEALPALLGEGAGRLGFDETELTVRTHRKLLELLPSGWEPMACNGAVERLRAIKDENEVARIRAASQLADQALREVLEGGLAGRTEHEVAVELELRMRRLGAESSSFPSIVAAGAHGALPHAGPREQEIPHDVLVTIDWGAVLEGYCSDCTRTYATGEGISQEARDVYGVVLGAQLQGLGAVQAGRSGREVDAIARGVIEDAGFGEEFGHGLGHGVGMEVHEGPRLSRTASEDPLVAGNVVTVEPGIYLPGKLGVRIEDLVVVEEDAQDVLTSLSKELTVIS